MNDDTIERTAREHGLGSLVLVRKLTNPLVVAGGYLAAAAVAWALGYLLTRIGMALDGVRGLQKSIGFLALALLIFGCAFVVAAVVALIRGSRAYYLWDGGFVYRRNGRVRAYPWAQVAELQMRRYEAGEDAGKIRDYRLVPGEGRPITVPLRLTDEHDPFNEALADAVRAAGRPVS